MKNEDASNLIKQFEGKTKVFHMFSATVSDKVKEMANMLFESNPYLFLQVGDPSGG